MPQLIGKTLGPYQVTLHIRSTHTNAIYKALDTRLGRSVALQVILPEQPLPDTLVNRMKEHSLKIGALAHPNIGRLLDCEVYEGLLCLAYDFVPHRMLRRRFNRNMTWTQAARALVPVAEVLAYAHKQGVIHGNLRPSSVLLREDLTPVLFDFGVDRLVTETILAEMPGTWFGSEISSYMAPEQVVGKAVDQRADIYSFGMIFYELVTGKRAFQGETTFEEIILQYGKKVSQPKKSAKEVPETASLILEKALAPEPEKRFQEMEHLQTLLAKMLLSQSIHPRMIRDPRWKPRKPLPPLAWVGIALGFVVLVSLGSFQFFRTNPQIAGQLGIVFPTAAPPPTIVAQAAATASPTLPAATPTATQPPPTRAAEAPAQEQPAPTQAPAREPVVFQRLPALFNTPVPKTSGAITPANAVRILAISRLGIGEAKDIAWSPPDGSRLALATTTGVYILNSEDDSIVLYLDTVATVFTVAFSPDGSLIATGEKDGLIRLWDTANGEEIAWLSGHLGPVREVVFSPDGSLLASVSDDQTARLWDVANQANLHILTDNPQGVTHTRAVNGAAFSPDNSLLATVSADFYLKLWDTSDGRLVHSMNAGAGINDVAFTVDGQTILTGGSNFTVQRWNVETGLQQDPLATTVSEITQLKISPDGTMIAVGDASGQVKVLGFDGTAKWEARNTNLPRQGSLLADYPHRIAFSPDSRRLASAIWDDTVRVWSAQDGTDIRTVTAFTAFATRLEVSPDGRYLAAQSIDGTVQVWDLPTARRLHTWSGTLTMGRIFSSDSRSLAVKKNQGTVSVFSLADGVEVFTFNGNPDAKSISFSSDGLFLVVGRDVELKLWSLSSGQEIIVDKNTGLSGCTIINDQTGNALAYATRYHYVDMVKANNSQLCKVVQGGWMRVLSFQKDGSLFAAGGSSNLEVWDYRVASTGRVAMQGLTGKTVEGIAISDSGSLIAAATNDQKIRVYNIKTGQEIVILEGHQASITGLVFSPDDTFLISSSIDGTIRVWGVQ